MPVKEDKTRTNITFPKVLKAELEKIAEEERRSFNNTVIVILEDYVKQKQAQSKENNS